MGHIPGGRANRMNGWGIYLEGGETVFGGHVPHAHAAVPARTRQPLTRPIEGNARHDVGMALRRTLEGV
eukprot:2902739-Pyramimonas_sp.AAC.1